MLADSPVVRSTGPRVLFLLSASVTVAIMLWTWVLRSSGALHGLAAIFFVLYAYNDYTGAICAVLILFATLLLGRTIPGRLLLRWIGDHPVIIAVVTAICLAAGTLVIYHNHPLAMDEYAAYFQSHIFAAGHLHGSFPPLLLDWLIPPGFQDYFLNVSHVTGSVAETYWPGFALLLTPFTWAGVPWLCNPIITALTLIAIHRLALEIFDNREAAGVALLLTIASPVIFANGISYYSMPAHLLANCVFALLLLRPTPVRVFAAGIVGSIALALHNPVPHMLFAVPWLIWITARKGGIKFLLTLGAGYLPLCALLGLGWFIFSGDLLHQGLATAAGGSTAASSRFQSMLSIFSIPNSTVVLARFIGLAKVWIWAVPGLMILACAGAVRWRGNAACRLFAASALLTIVGYFLVPVDQGHGWGYRYFHSAWMALPLLATAAMFRPAYMLASAGAAQSRTTPPGMFENSDTISYVAVCAVLTLVFGVGFRAWQMQSFMATDLSQLPHYKGTERRVVIIDDRHSFYGGDLVQNDPWLRGNAIKMYRHGAAADAAMMAQYFPQFHQVYAGRYGTVWSAAVSARTPAARAGTAK